MRKFLPALSALLLLSCSMVSADDEKYVEPTALLSGKVTSQQNLPVAHALVVVTDRTSRERQTTTTDRHGEFQLVHKPTADESVHVIPPVKSELAQIIISRVPAEEDRHLLLSAKPGFRISGRILAAGKPLKGVEVRAVSRDADTVHSGGETVTDGKGRYSMTLTPGEKTLEVFSRTQPEFSALTRQKVCVSNDRQLADVTLTRTQTAENSR